MPEFNDYTTMEKRLMDLSVIQKTPINGSIELLPLCNLNCKMCYVHLTKEQMEKQGQLKTVDEWVFIANQMKQVGVLYLLLTGGEPLLYPGFKELYLALQDMGMIITINTNGTLINDEWAQFFKEHRPRRINITIYGKDNETYLRQCGHPKGFDLTINAVKLLKANGIDVRLGFSMAKDNYQDTDEIIKLTEKIDSFIVVDTYMMPAIRERDIPYPLQSRCEPKLAGNKRFYNLQQQMGKEKFNQFVVNALNDVNHYHPLEVPINTCYAGRCSFTINWQGNIRPCVILEKPDMNVFETSFIEAWEYTRNEVMNYRISKTCNECKLRSLCRTCMAAAYLETGQFDGTPQYLCDYTNEFYRLIKEYANENNL